jgi:hypothetical protein
MCLFPFLQYSVLSNLDWELLFDKSF